jgi:hypothetical protein
MKLSALVSFVFPSLCFLVSITIGMMDQIKSGPLPVGGLKLFSLFIDILVYFIFRSTFLHQKNQKSFIGHSFQLFYQISSESF